MTDDIKDKKIPCSVIEDLLPLYAEQLTRTETNYNISEHLAECEECSLKYSELLGENVSKNKSDENKSELDYLKKVRTKSKTNAVIAVSVSVLIILAAILIKISIIGSPTDAYYAEINVENNIAHIKGTITDSATVYRSFKIKNGEIIIYGALPLFGNGNGSFDIDYDLKNGKVGINGMSISNDGTIVSEKANKIYKNKNKYIGNMAANGDIASACEIGKKLGSFKNSLQTTNEPYGWTLEFEDEVRKSNEEKFNADMQAYSCVLLSAIENCGTISWTYVCENKVYKREVTKEQADIIVGADIKTFSKSPEKVQELLEIVGIK